jgi:hypothetical protein
VERHAEIPAAPREAEGTLSPIADAPIAEDSAYRWAAVDLLCRALNHAEAAYVLMARRQGYPSVMATRQSWRPCARCSKRRRGAHMEAAFWDAWQAAKGPGLQGPPVPFRLESR